MEIRDTIVIITGASGGIGLATARLLSKNGAKVALVARSTDKLASIAATLPGSFAVTADMSRGPDIRNMVKSIHGHYGRIDVLINNAGRGMWNSAEKTDLEQYRGLMESAYASTKYALNAISLTARAELAADNIRVGIMLPGMTATDFGKNAVGSRPAGRGAPAPGSPAGPAPAMPPVETAEQVAEKIMEAIQTESAEVLANSMQTR